MENKTSANDHDWISYYREHPENRADAYWVKQRPESDGFSPFLSKQNPILGY